MLCDAHPGIITAFNDNSKIKEKPNLALVLSHHVRDYGTTTFFKQNSLPKTRKNPKRALQQNRFATTKRLPTRAYITLRLFVIATVLSCLFCWRGLLLLAILLAITLVKS